MAEKVNVDKALDINKDGFSNGGIDIETPGQNLERDPRTKTLANGMQSNVIPTGDVVEVKELDNAMSIGPIMMGMSKAIHVLQLGASVEEMVNMSAVAVVDAQKKSKLK